MAIKKLRGDILTEKKDLKSKKTARPKARQEEPASLNNRVLSIIIFATAVFLLCLVLIKGENVWFFLHNFILGLFGKIAIFWPVVLLYIAGTTAMAQPKERAGAKVVLSVIVVFLLCTSVYIFEEVPQIADANYFQSLLELYKRGEQATGAGLFSGILGIPVIYLFGAVGARITISLLFFVATMLLTGISLATLYNALKKVVVFVADGLKSCFLKAEPDEDDDETQTKFPDHPVKSNAIFERLKENAAQKFAKGNSDDVFEDSAKKAAEAFIEKNKKKKVESAEFEASEVKLTPDKTDESTYNYPPASLLEPTKEQNQADIRHELQTNGQMLVDTLNSFAVQTKIVDISRGPAVTRYELQPAAGVKISKITNLADDIALNLAALGVRIEAPIPGKAAVGIEIPNKIVNIVKMRELVNSDEFASSKSKLTVILGRDIAGNVTLADLSKMPHLLIAGSTGSGKSVCINSFIISLLYKASPEEVRLLMIDPKVVELGIYNGIPHLLVPVVTDPRKAAGALNWAVTEMLKRYNIFAENNVRDLTSYNKMVQNKMKSGVARGEEEKFEKMPQIVIIIDELADLMMAAPNEVEDAICRLAQMARAAGMHLVIATQRPSVDVITGVIKANIPSRIALSVSSQIDSRTILDSSGAEKLLGRGDMLFSPIGASKPLRVQGCFLTDKEIENVLSFIKNNGQNEYDQTVIEEIEKNAVQEPSKEEKFDDNKEQDPMLEEAINCVMEVGQASTSLLQRRLRLGYARAGRLIDEMERMGIVGPHEGSKPRQILVKNYQMLDNKETLNRQ